MRMNLKGIEALSKEIKCIAELLSIQISKLKEYRCSDYSNLNKEDRTFLGEIVNNALSLSYLLNKKFENEECVNV